MQGGGINIPIIVSAEQALGLLDEVQQAFLTAGESGETMKSKLDGLGQGIERALGEAAEKARVLENQLEAINRRIESQTKIRDKTQGDLNRALLASGGNDTAATLKLQDEIAKLDVSIAKLEADSLKAANALANVDDEMSRLSQSSDTVAKAAEQAGQSMQDAGQKGKQGAEEAAAGADKATIAYTAMAAAAAKGFQIILGAVQDGIAANNEQITVQQKLAHVMSNTMGAASSEVKSIQSLISAQEKLGVVSKTAQTAGAQELATYLTMGSSLQTLIPIMNDMAAQQLGIGASAESVVNIATMLGKVMDGQVGGLSRYGYSFTEAQEEILKTGTEMERVAVLADVVSASVGGMNEALGQTDPGKMWQAAEASGDFSESLGGALSPAAGLASEMISKLLGELARITSESPGVAAGITTTVTAMLGFAGISKAVAALQSFTGAATAAEAATKILNTTLSGSTVAWGGIAALAGIGVAIYTQWKKAQEEAAAAAKEQAEAVQASIAVTQNQKDAVQALSDEYNTLIKKEGKSLEDKQRIKAIEEELSSQYGVTSTQVDGLSGSYDSLTQSLEAYIQAQNDSLEADTRLALKLGRSDMPEQKKDIEALVDAYNALNEQIEAEQALVDRRQSHSSTESERREWKDERDRLKAEIDQGIIDNATIDTKVAQAWDHIMAATASNGAKLDATMTQMAHDAFQSFADANPTGAVSDEFVNGLIDAFSKLDFSKIQFDKSEDIQQQGFQISQQVREMVANVNAELEKLGSEIGIDETGLNHILDSFLAQAGLVREVTGDMTLYAEAVKGVGDAAQETQESLEEMTGEERAQKINLEIAGSENAISSLEDVRKKYQDVQEEIKELEETGADPERLALLQAQSAEYEKQYEIQQESLEARLEENELGETKLEALAAELEALAEISEKEEQQLGFREAASQLRAQALAEQMALGKAITDTTQATQQATTALQKMEQSAKGLNQKVTLNNELKALTKEAKSAEQSFDQMPAKLQAWARANGLVGASTNDISKALEKEGDTLAAETATMAAAVNEQLNYWYDKKNSIEANPVTGEFDADGSALMAEAESAISILETLLALLGVAGGTSGEGGEKKKGGGGGGKKKDSAISDVNDVAKAQKEALDEELRLMERNKRAGTMNTRQEINELLWLYEKYSANAELRLQLEEKIYDARARLRDEEITQLDRLSEGILTALRNRYEAQRKLEQNYLDESIKAWQTWADETVAAIQAQIDALEEEEKVESRAEKEEKALRKIASLRQELLYTTDEYARYELEKEIARQEEDLAKQRRDWAREDEKERLQKEIETVQARAQAEQAAIEEQKTALDEVYDKLTSNANLQAEAQALMGRTQQEMVDIIAQYAPEFEATGKSLGERMYDGLASAWGSISGWFEGFNNQITYLQDRAAAAANQLANQYYSGQLTGGMTGATTPPAVTVDQVVNFNVPVEKASDVTSRMEYINEELAAQIAG